MINNKTISNWVRQTRHRAKKNNTYSDLNVSDIQDILQLANYCAYCEKEAETIDCPFPLKDGCPNVPANTVLCCRSCKSKKNNNDIIWMYINGYVEYSTYLKLIRELCSRRGGDIIKTHIKTIVGLADDNSENGKK